MTQAKADGGRTARAVIDGPWEFCADHPQNACAYVKDGIGIEIATIYGGGFDDGAPQNSASRPINRRREQVGERA